MILRKRKQLFFLAGLSAILLILPWYRGFSGLILFIAFVPLLFIERRLYDNRTANRSIQAFFWSYLVFFIWNFFTTYWIYNATLFGAAAAIFINALFMATVFWLFHLTHRVLGHQFGYFSFLAYWTGFEYIYLNAEISWPWLNLGNGLAKDLSLIQWFEFTGSTSATPWIIMINILVFILLSEYIRSKNIRKRIFELIVLGFIIGFPITLSLILFQNQNQDTSEPYDIVVLQPNIDPYNNPYTDLSNEKQLEIILHLADSLTDSETDYVIGPEAALDDNIWENHILKNRSIQKLKEFVAPYPGLKFVIGMITLYEYGPDETPSLTARKFRDNDARYDVYNASVQVDRTDQIQVYHKSKLVIGVEKLPFPKLFRRLEKFIIKLGGTTGSYGIQEKRTNLVDPDGPARAGTMICYESVYGAFVTEYVKAGANLLFVITNDGWWDDTPGYKQHLTYSSLRAIETRRSIARSASTGISCFINWKGEILQSTDWGTSDAIKGTLHPNDRITYYVKHGDFISRIALFFGILTCLYMMVISIIRKQKGTATSP